MPALLAASSVRVDVAGIPALDGLSLETTGDRVLVVGAARALFEAAAGLRTPERGEILIEGMAPLAAVRAGIAAGAPLDPPMPPRWTVFQYASWSARLAGHARGDAGTGSRPMLLARMELSAMRNSKLGAAATAVRRATVVAAALATGAGTILLEDPLPGLPEESARAFARLVVKALADWRTAFFTARVILESPVALASDEAVVIDGSQVIAQSAPTTIATLERTLALRVSGDVDTFAREVQTKGGSVIITANAPRPAYVRVELGPLAPRDLLRIAQAAHAVVLELRPLGRAFA